MHNFRLRWVALGLLMYVQGAICRTSPLCPTADAERFDDVPSRTVGARAIVEAIAQQVRPVPDVAGRLHVKFRVEQIHKWDSTFPPYSLGVKSDDSSNVTRSRRPRGTNSSSSSSSASSSSMPSEVFCEAVFGGSSARESKRKAPSSSSSRNCSVEHTGKAEVKRRSMYLLFIGHRGGAELANDSDHVVCKSRLNGSHVQTERLSLSGFPLRVTKSASNDVKRFASCSKCRRRPRVTLHPTEKELIVGTKLSLHCRVVSGKPRVIVTWFKDDVPLAANDRRVVIKTNARTSQLQIRQTTAIDAGTYGCEARTVLSPSERQLATVVITSAESNGSISFGEPCPVEFHNYCMNGGTCAWMSKLQTQLCQCKGDFEGPRCAERKTFLGALTKRRRRHHHQPHHFDDSHTRYSTATSDQVIDQTP